MPEANSRQQALVDSFQGVVPNVTEPTQKAEKISEKLMEKQLEKAKNKAARDARKAEEKAFKRGEPDAPTPAKVILDRDMDQVDKNLKALKATGSPMPDDEYKKLRYIDQASAYGKYAESVKDDRREARWARDEQEKLQLKADSLSRKTEIQSMDDSPEKDKLWATFKRHAWFDRAKKFFRRENVLSHQDAQFEHGGEEFTNIGRAFYGGTKPMYRFEDSEKNVHLYKEAVNCLGMSKPSGALVTEAASKIQNMVCDDAYVPAFAIRSEEGRVLGSMQKMLKKDENGIDLFSIQDDPNKMKEAFEKNPNLGNEIIREHALDWVLCNFDTKGENFIPLATPNPDGSTITSIDKEASFNHLKDEGAQHMSRTYKPHSNDTFYNVMFTAYAEGKIDLDFSAMDKMAKKVESIDDKKYMDCFSDMLDDKYGPNTPERKEAANSILDRKQNIGKEYKSFQKQLVAERTKNMDVQKTQDEPEKKAAAPKRKGH